MKELKRIVIKGKPISKDNQKRGQSRSGRFFIRPEYRKYEDNVGLQAAAQMIGQPPFKDDLFVVFVFYLKNKRHCDLLNLPKSLCDALNGIVWEDDRQIKMAYLQIFYLSGVKDEPLTEIIVNKI